MAENQIVIRSARCGLSLIEVVIVVVILGIIAAIVVPRVTLATEGAKARLTQSHLAQLNAACERYYLEQGTWPTTLADLVPSYLPDGVPGHPQGGTFTINATTHRVE
jgi:prepilin-type N-terminal cleavage/methylation domain-containing protein